MSSLFVYPVTSPQMPTKVLNHLEDITSTLADYGVRIECFPASTRVRPGTGQEDVISACRVEIDRLMTERGLATVEVISRDNDQPPGASSPLREEHVHGGAHLHWFVAGRGLLNLHLGDHVYALLCERDDLVSLPAGTRQWFDMGEHPHIVAVRLFGTPDEAIAKPTGDGIAGHFAGLDD